MRTIWSLIGLLLIGLLLYVIGNNYNKPIALVLGALLGVISVLGIFLRALWDPLKTLIRNMFVFKYSISYARAWARLIRRCLPDAQPLLLSFINRYIEEEIADISGKSQASKNFVVTNFVAYSQYVTKIVEAASEHFSKVYGEHYCLFCFTTLVMSPIKWFNFNEDNQVKGQFLSVDEKWEKYKQFLMRLVASPKKSSSKSESSVSAGNIKVERCIVVVNDTPKNNGDEEDIEEDINTFRKLNENPSFAFKLATDMTRHFFYPILVPAKEGKSQFSSLKPINTAQIETWLKGDLKMLKTDLDFYLKDTSGANGHAYLILPNEHIRTSQLKAPHHYKWERVGRTFIELFHTHPPYKYAKFKTLNWNEWHSYFDKEIEDINKIPEDLFVIGFCKDDEEKPDWVFCLAADIDENNDKLSLEFICDGMNPVRFRKIKEFVDEIRTKSIDLNHWITEHTPT